jgi:uncharacterized protein DUF927
VLASTPLASSAFEPFAMIETAIALPGDPGEKIDWLDILRRDGVDAVRNGILSAPPFEATSEELETPSNRQHEDEIHLTQTRYPLPEVEGIALAYQIIKNRVLLCKVVKAKEGVEFRPISTPFCIPSWLQHLDQNDNTGLRVVVQGMDGEPHEIDFNRSELAQRGAADILSELFAKGLQTQNDGDKVVVQILKAAHPKAHVVVVQRPGVHYIDGRPVFVAPDNTVLGETGGLLVELAVAVRLSSDVARGGTLEGWKACIAAAVHASNCPHWILGVVAGFVGPILSLAGLDSCGINLSGLSSSGKSIAQRLAVSAWSVPSLVRAGLFQSARVTENSIEISAIRASGTVLALDELAHIAGKLLPQIIHAIAGGVSKRRMRSDETTRETKTWSVFAIFSCEHSLEEKVRSDGGDWMAGLAARNPDINVTGINRNVDENTLAAINLIDSHHGHTGVLFVRALMERGPTADDLRERVIRAADQLSGHQADSTKKRAAIPFALLFVAGELARSFELIPEGTDVAGAVQWAWQQFLKSSDAAALAPEEQAIENIRCWIFHRFNVTLKDVAESSGVNNRETLGYYKKGVAVYIPKSSLREAAGNCLTEIQIAELLDKRGFLASKEPGRHYTRYIPSIGKMSAYALSWDEFGRSDTVRDPSSIDEEFKLLHRDDELSTLRSLLEEGRLKILHGCETAVLDGVCAHPITAAQLKKLQELDAPEIPAAWLAAWPATAN